VAAAHDLMQRQWKGNCRELRNLVERMSILYPGTEITLQNLQPGAPMLVSEMIAVERQSELALHPQTAAASPMPASVGLEENVPPRLFEPLAVDEQPSNTYELADMLVSGIDISQGCDLKQQLIAVETQLIQKALDATSGNVSKASQLLSVRRTTLIEKIKKYQLQEAS
jgi:sigma-54 specific flagellar transcriptional regulator A